MPDNIQSMPCLASLWAAKKGLFVLISEEGRSSAVQSVTERDVMGEGGGV